MKDFVVESRLNKDGYRVRVYRRDDGTKYRTVEVPLEVMRAKTTRARIEMSLSAAERIRRRESARGLLLAGFSAKEVQAQTGLGQSTVYEMRAALLKQQAKKRLVDLTQGRRTPVASVFDLGKV